MEDTGVAFTGSNVGTTSQSASKDKNDEEALGNGDRSGAGGRGNDSTDEGERDEGIILIKTNQRKWTSCARGEKTIRPRKKARQIPYLPPWLAKLWPISPTSRRPRTAKRSKIRTCSYPTIVLLLTLLLLCLYLLLQLDTLPQLLRRRTMSPKTQTYPGHPSSTALRLPNRQFALSDVPSLPSSDPIIEDYPRVVLRAIAPLPTDQMTHGLIAIQHMQPLSVGTSHPAREFLGKATLACIRQPDGELTFYRSDIHIRLLGEDPLDGWDAIDPLSTREVGLLQDILFREKPYDGVMENLRAECRSICTNARNPGSDKPAPAQDDPGLAHIEEAGMEEVAEIKIGPPKRSGKVRSKNRKTGTDLAASGKPAKPSVPDDFDAILRANLHDTKTYTLESNNGCLPKHGILACPELTGTSVTSSDVPSLTSEAFEVLFPNLEADPKDLANQGKDTVEDPTRPQSSRSTDPSAAAPVKKEARSSEEVLVEVIDVLEKLRKEFGQALDNEAKELVNQVEISAGRILEKRERREGSKVDDDGDVEMEGHAPGDRKGKAPAVQPNSPSPPNDDPCAPRSPAATEHELLNMYQNLEEEFRTGEWYRERDLSKMDERLSAAERQLRTIEKQRGDEDAWSVAGNSKGRNHSHRFATKVVLNKVERKVEAATGDVFLLRTKMEDIEKVVEEWEMVRKKVNGLAFQLAGLEGEMMASGKKIYGLESKFEEARLRHDATTRDINQGKAAFNSGLTPRVSRLETRLTFLEYQAGTLDEKAMWADRKLQNLWVALSTPNISDSVRAHSVHQVWELADRSLVRRAQHAPTPPQSFPPPVPAGVPALPSTSINDPTDSSTTSITTANPFASTSTLAKTY
jgi:hypothetical protein